jgi:hypothetical protein
MPSNLQAYRQMADSAALQITGSHESWKAFLQTAVRLFLSLSALQTSMATNHASPLIIV